MNQVLTFVRDSGLRKVYLKGRTISIVSSGLNVPFVFDLDKLDSKEAKKIFKKSKMNKKDRALIHELSRLNNQDLIAKDIIKDYQKDRWRLVKKDGCY